MRLTSLSKSYNRGQKALAMRLMSLGQNVDLEHRVGRCFVDIFLSDENIAVELDGPFHSRKKDETRDAYLCYNGIRKVIHFGYDDLMMSDDELLERIFG